MPFRSGYNMPPGCFPHHIPGWDDDGPCAVCEKPPDECTCPECAVCGAIGDPGCNKDHPIGLSPEVIRLVALHGEVTIESDQSGHGYVAWFGEYDEGVKLGTGDTMAEALEDLLKWYDAEESDEAMEEGP